ncbi:MAG: isoaspartyl peptidase/L-asparaginase [Proteobacteria bacterium]|nr:isoaspartyl peptidase/L-asparaginase [Pseudomonadota bacterium]
MNPYSIIIHGGAGDLDPASYTDADLASYKSVLKASVDAGYALLQAGRSSLDAITAAIVILEDSDLFNAGRGAVLNHQGTVDHDAAIMSGDGLRAGAVAGITCVRNPIMLATEVLRHSNHVMLMGPGAEAFGRDRGLAMVDNAWFQTDRRRRQLIRVQASDRPTALSEDGSDRVGTVGAVAMDQAGHIAAGTSTGGMANKRYGRVGDSPIIGAGTYAADGLCGVSASGHGEYFIRLVVAHEICSRMRYGSLSLQAAADATIDQLAQMGGDGGVIAIDAAGQIVTCMNTKGMYRAWRDSHGHQDARIFRDT